MRSAICVSLALMGCANSSGVIKTCPDTFTISTPASPGKGGVPAAKRIAFEEANTKCNVMGREVLALSEKTHSPNWTEGMANMELNFGCLLAGDPEFTCHKLEAAPDEILEPRRR